MTEPVFCPCFPIFYPELLEKEGIACKMFAPIKPVFSTHYNNRDHRRSWSLTEKLLLPAERTWQMNILTANCGLATGRIRQ